MNGHTDDSGPDTKYPWDGLCFLGNIFYQEVKATPGWEEGSP